MPALSIPVSEELSGKKFYHKDFKNMDLKKRNMRNSLFFCCCFDDADLTEANCEGSDFTRSTFRNTNLYRTNWKDCRLAGIVFEPKDAFGLCWSLQCRTFDTMAPGPLWAYAYLVFFLMMEHKGEMALLADKVIAAIGAEKYVKLKALFSKREL